MNRNLVINMVLIVAGILLAFALFGAGALWKGKTTPKNSTLTVGNSWLSALAVKRRSLGLTRHDHLN